MESAVSVVKTKSLLLGLCFSSSYLSFSPSLFHVDSQYCSLITISYLYLYSYTHTHTLFLSLVPPLPLSGSYGLLSSTKCSEMPLELLHFLNSQAASYVPSPSGAIFSHLDAPSQMRQSLLQLSHKPDYASPLKVRRLRRSYLLHTGR